MIRELSSKVIYSDFVDKMLLTEDELKVLNMMLLKYSLVKISCEINMSDRNVSRIICEIKAKYKNYKLLEMAKLGVFKA